MESVFVSYSLAGSGKSTDSSLIAGCAFMQGSAVGCLLKPSLGQMVSFFGMDLSTGELSATSEALSVFLSHHPFEHTSHFLCKAVLGNG
jgi:hypothetical protein